MEYTASPSVTQQFSRLAVSPVSFLHWLFLLIVFSASCFSCQFPPLAVSPNSFLGWLFLPPCGPEGAGLVLPQTAHRQPWRREKGRTSVYYQTKPIRCEYR
ncbi:hypothetical protein RRG08_002685 [Elysia crispata]|uniref:Uncharacterized protein n=1 Tax=Elysia crispata TaxID=231223 RepID=A0AAE0XU53_9GAST|nr:hypothetical protein RRG08_002685 [Elysia crispata]